MHRYHEIQIQEDVPSPRNIFSIMQSRLVIQILALIIGLKTCGISAASNQWTQEKNFRWRPYEVSAQGSTGFKYLNAESTGIQFTNIVTEEMGAANRVLYNGAGVATGDYDQDGLPDIFLCNISGKNVLYKNIGNCRFQDVTAEAGLAAPLPESRGAVFADINGDGWLDLLISVNSRGVLCFLNDTRGKFVDMTSNVGTASKLGSTSMTLADVDGNGTLDLYVTNYRPDDIRDRGRVAINMVKGRPVMAGAETNRFMMVNNRLEECGQPDQLLLNDGAGHFKLVSWTTGAFLDEDGKPLAEPPVDWGLTATFRDVNNDMAPDLYVCNDYWTPDRFWINDGTGKFRAIAKMALRKTSASSMSVDFADINRDGCLDFFVVDMLSRYPWLRKREDFAQMPYVTPIGMIDDRPQVMRNTMYLGRPDGTYAEMAYFANIPGSDWSWAPIYLDVDLDGYEDLIIGAGHFRDVQDYDAEIVVRSRQHSWNNFKNDVERQKVFTRELMENYRLYPLLQMPIGAFRNTGKCSFEECTDTWGLNQPGVHQGIAMADFDGDGDSDLVVNNLNSGAAIYRNDGTAGRIMVRLKGKTPNTAAIGAKVTLSGGSVARQTTEIICGGRYQSGCDTAVTFGSGPNPADMSIEVQWRNGTRTVIQGVQRNRYYEIFESEPTPAQKALPHPDNPLYTDASELINHKHPEIAFNDYERQPLLPFKLSQLGPGIAWFDMDGDGHDDLIIGAGRMGKPAIYKNGGGKFQPLPTPNFSMSQDAAGLVGWTDSKGNRSLISGLTGYEATNTPAAIVFKLNKGQLESSDPIAPEMPTGGALALGDMDGNGQWSLFIAGGVVPGQYPLGAPSKIYRFEGGQWQLDSKNSVLLQNLGIVNGAVWSDLDGDGKPELILACEWGPIRVFSNQGGILYEATDKLGLKTFTGWWRGVTTGDFNNDGKMDIIASNWGLNSPYRASAEKPLVFAYGQLAQPGVMEIIETEYVNGKLYPRRQFAAMLNSMPFLYEIISSHKAYSEATLDQVLGERSILSRRVSAITLASMVFINEGNRFKAVELPMEAQLAPAFAVNVGDVDGDGNEDVFLSQNFFDTHPETTRIDAGLGLLLKGNGAGQFKAIPCSDSGLKVYGQQRGACFGDFDEDGRLDLAVTQNGAQTKLFRNNGATPGYRIKLKGPTANPDGIGAALRFQFKDRQGPAREIHAGSGYWSQDSSVQVMAAPVPPEKLSVRWPGGKITSLDLPKNTRNITIDSDGKFF